IVSTAIGELASIAQMLSPETGGGRAETTQSQIAPPRLPAPDRAQPVKLPIATFGGLTTGAEVFLRTAITAIGVSPVFMSWGQLGVLCRRKAHGGSFNTARKLLLEGGYVTENRGLVEVQKPGFEHRGEEPPATPLN